MSLDQADNVRQDIVSDVSGEEEASRSRSCHGAERSKTQSSTLKVVSFTKRRQRLLRALFVVEARTDCSH